MPYDQNLQPVPIVLPKRALDVILSATLLLVTLPLSLIILIAIIAEGVVLADSRGSLFYTEVRISQGRPFRLMKFRIFKVRAIKEDILTGTLSTKEAENKPGNLTWAGRIMKKWGFDEIPQLANILKGEMSFVGPRPRPLPEYESEIRSGIYYRKIIHAGLTGLAQIRKGTQRTFEEDIAKDAEYVYKCRTLSSWQVVRLDLSILYKTVSVVLKGTGE